MRFKQKFPHSKKKVLQNVTMLLVQISYAHFQWNLSFHMQRIVLGRLFMLCKSHVYIYLTNLSQITSIFRDIFKNHDPSLSSCVFWKVQCTIYNQFYNSIAKNKYQTQTVFTQLRSIIEFLKLFSSKTLKVDVLYRCRKLSILKENNWPIEKRRIISMVNNELTWYRFERKWSDSARVAKGSQRVGTGRGTRIVAGARDHRRAES